MKNKNLLARIFDWLDKKLQEQAKKRGRCCCDANAKKENKTGPCCSK